MEPKSINLADPDFEPTDEQLRDLSKAAFADVPGQNAATAARLSANIEHRRREWRRWLAELNDADKGR